MKIFHTILLNVNFVKCVLISSSSDRISL